MKNSLLKCVSQSGWARVAGTACFMFFVAVGPLSGQVVGGTLRPYWHVFIAYAVAWIVVVGWLIQIARRLGRVAHDGS